MGSGDGCWFLTWCMLFLAGLSSEGDTGWNFRQKLYSANKFVDWKLLGATDWNELSLSLSLSTMNWPDQVSRYLLYYQLPSCISLYLSPSLYLSQLSSLRATALRTPVPINNFPALIRELHPVSTGLIFCPRNMLLFITAAFLGCAKVLVICLPVKTESIVNVFWKSLSAEQ